MLLHWHSQTAYWRCAIEPLFIAVVEDEVSLFSKRPAAAASRIQLRSGQIVIAALTQAESPAKTAFHRHPPPYRVQFGRDKVADVGA
jgi:hypothetical protein